MSYEEFLQSEKERDLRAYHFSKKELKNPITKASLINKLIQYRQRERYPQFLIKAEMLG